MKKAPCASTSSTAWLTRQARRSYQSPESATRARDFRIGKGLIQGGERRRFAMAVPLRADFDAVGVRCWARKSKDGPQARRFWRWRRFMREPVGRRRPGLAG